MGFLVFRVLKIQTLWFSGLWHRVVWYMCISVSEEYTASILNVKTDAAGYSETASIYQTTRCQAPEAPHLPPSEWPPSAVNFSLSSHVPLNRFAKITNHRI